MLKVTWRGKLQAVNFEEEFTRYGEEWTDYVTLEDLITKLSHTTKVPFERIKLLHSGGKCYITLIIELNVSNIS